MKSARLVWVAGAVGQARQRQGGSRWWGKVGARRPGLTRTTKSTYLAALSKVSKTTALPKMRTSRSFRVCASPTGRTYRATRVEWGCKEQGGWMLGSKGRAAQHGTQRLALVRTHSPCPPGGLGSQAASRPSAGTRARQDPTYGLCEAAYTPLAGPCRWRKSADVGGESMSPHLVAQRDTSLLGPKQARTLRRMARLGTPFM